MEEIKRLLPFRLYSSVVAECSTPRVLTFAFLSIEDFQFATVVLSFRYTENNILLRCMLLTGVYRHVQAPLSNLSYFH
jgi:hypothetical protein